MRALDFGTGCGAAAFGYLLLEGREVREHTKILGLDTDPAMVQAALENAERLGLTDQYQAVVGDVAELLAGADAGSLDLVLANPPYRAAGSGRLPQGVQQDVHYGAMFEAAGGLTAWLGAAAHVLKDKGFLCLVFAAARLDELLAALGEHALVAKRLRFVHGREAKDAKIVLLEARKNVRPSLTVEPPLVLHAGEAAELKDAALAFCPYLSCNSGTADEDGS